MDNGYFSFSSGDTSLQDIAGSLLNNGRQNRQQQQQQFQIPQQQQQQQQQQQFQLHNSSGNVSNSYTKFGSAGQQPQFPSTSFIGTTPTQTSSYGGIGSSFSSFSHQYGIKSTSQSSSYSSPFDISGGVGGGISGFGIDALSPHGDEQLPRNNSSSHNLSGLAGTPSGKSSSWIPEGSSPQLTSFSQLHGNDSLLRSMSPSGGLPPNSSSSNVDFAYGSAPESRRVNSPPISSPYYSSTNGSNNPNNQNNSNSNNNSSSNSNSNTGANGMNQQQQQQIIENKIQILDLEKQMYQLQLKSLQTGGSAGNSLSSSHGNLLNSASGSYTGGLGSSNATLSLSPTPTPPSTANLMFNQYGIGSLDTGISPLISPRYDGFGLNGNGFMSQSAPHHFNNNNSNISSGGVGSAFQMNQQHHQQQQQQQLNRVKLNSVGTSSSSFLGSVSPSFQGGSGVISPSSSFSTNLHQQQQQMSMSLPSNLAQQQQQLLMQQQQQPQQPQQLPGGGQVESYILKETPSRTLFVGNVSTAIDDESALSIFSQFGPVKSVMCTCKHRGFIIVDYFDIRHAQSAMRNMNSTDLNKRRLDIRYAMLKDCTSDVGTLVVFNLDPAVTNGKLTEMFGVYGQIKEIRETPNKANHKFIEFFDTREAAEANAKLNKAELYGKRLRIQYSRPGGNKKNLCNHSTSITNDPDDVDLNPLFEQSQIGMRSVFNPSTQPQTGGINLNSNNNSYSSTGNSLNNSLNLPNIVQPSIINNQNSNNSQSSSLSNSPSKVQTPNLIGVNNGSISLISSSSSISTTSTTSSSSSLNTTIIPPSTQGSSLTPSNSFVLQQQNSPISPPSSSSSLLGSNPNNNINVNSNQINASPNSLQGGWTNLKSKLLNLSNTNNPEITSPPTIITNPTDSLSLNVNSASPSSPRMSNLQLSKVNSVKSPRNQPEKSPRKDVMSPNSGSDPQYVLSIERVKQGLDTRTSLMIKNLPNRFTQTTLLSIVDEMFKGTYDFLYLPIDPNTKVNYGFAFINFISLQFIVPFYAEFNNRKWEKFYCSKICEITYARIQGKANLIQHLKTNDRVAANGVSSSGLSSPSPVVFISTDSTVDMTSTTINNNNNKDFLQQQQVVDKKL